MSKQAESDQQRASPIAPNGCEMATLALPCPVLSGPGTRAEPPASATSGKEARGQRACPAWVSRGIRGAWRSVKHLMPDELFLWLSHRRHVGRFPNLTDPETFNEFILHRCLNPEPQWSMLADKLAVREFVRERIGEEHLIPLIAVPEVFDEEVFASLPDAFVMKANHGCGYVRIVEDKRRTSFAELNGLAQAWLTEDFSRTNRERHYRPIRPRLYFEQLLVDRAGQIPSDLKMNMFGRDAAGPIIYSGVVSDRFGKAHGDVFDVRWNRLDLAVGHYPRSDIPPAPPPHWDEIVRLAMRLVEGLGYVRLDLYVPDGKVYFGELTFTPGAGVFPFHPDRYDYEWGRLFKTMSEADQSTDSTESQQSSHV